MDIKFENLSDDRNKNAYDYFTQFLIPEKKISTTFRSMDQIPRFFNFLSPFVNVTEVFQKIQFKNKKEYLFIYFNPLKLKIMEQIAFEVFQVNNVESLKNKYFFEYIDIMIFSVYFYVKDLGFISQKSDAYTMRNQIGATIQNINRKEGDQKNIRRHNCCSKCLFSICTTNTRK